jgi:DNA-binding XRE family transcriptional regulator
MTQAAIGRLLGISRQRVDQIEAELGLGKTDN